MLRNLFPLILVFCSSAALAQEEVPPLDCSKVVYGIPDLNCDGEIQVAVLGDSLVFGIGDTRNKNKGGYILRARKAMPKVVFQNLGVQGQRTFELISLIEDALVDDTNEEVKAVLTNADVIFLDVGRNDKWLFGEPIDTFKNLQKAATLIRTNVKKLTNIEPLVVTAAMMLPNRGSQGPFVKALNAMIIKSHSTLRPANLRFDLVSKRLLQFDQIHPTSKGYDALASTFVRYLRKNVPVSLRALIKKNRK